VDKDEAPGPSLAEQAPPRDADAVSADGEGKPPDGAQAPVPSGDVDAAAEAVVSGAAYAALGVLGVLIGLIGSFAQDWTADSVPIAAVVLVGVVFGVVRLAAWAMESPLGGVVTALGWGLVTLVMSLQRPEGDLVIPGTTPGYVYIVGGLVAAVIAAAAQPARRAPGEWLTRGPFTAAPREPGT
jgi:hypothetical protein